jgi:hypothetical protein
MAVGITTTGAATTIIIIFVVQRDLHANFKHRF